VTLAREEGEGFIELLQHYNPNMEMGLPWASGRGSRGKGGAEGKDPRCP